MAYIGQSLTEGTRRAYNYTATASQTTFNAVYTVGAVDVYQNGVLLTPDDYTASTGTTVVLSTGAAADDEITIICHNTFSVADTLTASQGGTFTGDVTFDGAFTSQGIDDNATSTAMTLDSSGNVGIGTTSPNLGSNGSGLHIKGASGEYGVLKVDSSTGSEEGWVQLSNNGVDKFRIASDSSTNLKFIQSGVAERMRIDSSGNLLVGKTATGLSNQGAEFSSTGQVKGTAPNQVVGYFNRTSSDGSILEFRKDNSTVGSISSKDGDIAIGVSGVGLRFGQNNSDQITPHSMTTNSGKDNSLTLGSAGARFKDLHLSGAVDLSDPLGPVNTIQAANHPSAAYTATNGSHDHWIELKSKGGTHVVLNSDGSRTTGRTNMDHFTVWQKDRDQTNGRLAFSVNNFGQAIFGEAGVGIDRGWNNYPSITVFRDSHNGDNNTAYNEFRVHGSPNTNSSWWGGAAGGDFSVNFRIDGGTYYSSDRRKKTNIESVTNALDTVMQIDGKRFQLVNSEGEAQTSLSKSGYKYGFIAQDIEDVIPDAVKYYADEDDGTENYNNSYSVDYGSVVALLTNAIKELKEENDAMRARLDALESN